MLWRIYTPEVGKLIRNRFQEDNNIALIFHTMFTISITMMWCSGGKSTGIQNYV